MPFTEQRLHKSTGYDGIPAEVIRNETCVGLLHKIISFAFDSGSIPSDWNKGIIVPIPKGDNSTRDPLGYRPITLISIPCKVYADILNSRVTNWLQANDLLSDCQNGLGKEGAVWITYTHCTPLLTTGRTNVKVTFVSFIDARKAFDTVQRDCLWYKLMTIGHAWKSIECNTAPYIVHVSCAVRVNTDLTDWFDCWVRG